MKKFLLLLLLFACQPKPSASVETKLTNDDNGKSIQLKANGTFSVTLRQCVGCAQIWSIAQMDESSLMLQSSTTANPSCTDCVGGNVDRIFTFKALKAGKSKVKLVYFDQEFAVDVEIVK